MTTVSVSVWRTELQLSVRAEVDPDLLDARLRGAVARLDAAASRFRSDSEVAELARRSGTWVPVSDLLLTLLTRALQVAQATDGLVHPGLGGPAMAAGYDVWAGSSTTLPHSRKVLPWQEIAVDPDGAVRIPRGMVLDLGATAKAWLADDLAAEVAAVIGADVLANMGGDVRCIAAQEPWPVLLDAELPGVARQPLALRNAGVATSGRARRHWSGGHHILDPRTGAPARTPWWSAAVIAADALGANAAATAAMVLGDAAPAWLESVGLTARLVAESGSQSLIGALDPLEVTA